MALRYRADSSGLGMIKALDTGATTAASLNLAPAARDSFRRVLVGRGSGRGGLGAPDPDVRYGLVEINLSSRVSDLTPGIREILFGWTVPLAALLPLLPAVDLRDMNLGRRLLLVGTLLIPVLSILPIPHYWIYVPLAFIPLLQPDFRPAVHRLFAIFLTVVAFLPLLANL